MSILSEAFQKRIEYESVRLNHYYLGVEHLFLALLKLPNSLTVEALKQCGLSPQYVAYLLEQALGQNPERRYWEGFRPTPRYEKVLHFAQAYASSDYFTEPDLLFALLEENDNVPIRLLESLGVAASQIHRWLLHWEDHLAQPPSLPSIQSELPLLEAELSLLAELFPAASTLRIEHELVNDYSGARIYAVAAHLAEGRVEKNLVRFDDPYQVMAEKHAHDQLAALAPIAPISKVAVTANYRLGGVSYQLASLNAPPFDLLTYAHQAGLHEVTRTLRKHIYDPLQAQWWQTRERYQFALWREYEFILPPALVITLQPISPEVTLRPLGEWSHNDTLALDTPVELQDFTIQTLAPHQNTLELKAGKGDEAVYFSSRVQVKDIHDMATYSPGKSLRSLPGVVINTRHHLLQQQVQLLDPNFELGNATLETPLGVLPNPLYALPSLLAWEVEGYLSPIHGALRLENIIVGDQMWLINGGQHRIGHVLFDWAMVEADVLQKLIAPLVEDDWAALWKIGAMVQLINRGVAEKLDSGDILAKVVSMLTEIRGIVQPLLGMKNEWNEYYAVLTLMGVAGMGNQNMPLGSRRLAWITAALALEAFQVSTPV